MRHRHHRTVSFGFCLVFVTLACFAWTGGIARADEGVRESEWDEATRGPLPRWREGGTPEPDREPFAPYSIELPGFKSAGTTGLIETPPEYAPADGVLFRYSTSSFASTVTDCVAALTGDPTTDEIAYVVVSNSSQRDAAKADFRNAGADISRVQFIIAPNDSVWLRDYGPHFVFQDDTLAVVDSHYYPGRPLDNFLPTVLADDTYEIPSYDMGLYYSGGNFQASTSRDGFITSLIDQDNPGFGEPFISELYDTYQGIDTLHIFPRLPSSVDGTGHIDMWFYLVDEDTVIISEFVPGSNAQAIQVTNDAAVYMANLGYEVFRVPDENSFHPQDSQAHFTYTNAYRVNDRIFISSYGEGNASFQTRDAEVLATWQAAAPGLEIVPINSYNIIWAAGAIHCIVKQVPRYSSDSPSAVVLGPSGGELLVSGTDYELKWNATDDESVSSIDLLYSTDGGATYDGTIAVGEPDDGSFTWNVPQLEDPSVLVKVVAQDDAANTDEASSATPFGVMSAQRHVYDFSSGAGVDKWAYGYTTPSWSSVSGIRRPAQASTQISSLVTDAYDKISASDATGSDGDPGRYGSPNPGSGSESTHIFEFSIDEDPALINDIEVLWEGYGDQCLQMELYVWDYVSAQWCDGAGQCGENRFLDNFAGNADEVLRGNIRDNFDRFIGSGGVLTLLLYAERSTQESFHDYVSVTVTSDNCPFLFNPDQLDDDVDFVGDLCDNCPATINTDQANADTDPFGNACDCAPADGGAFALPSEIQDLTTLPGGQTFTWAPENPGSGAGTLYEVLRGAVDELAVGAGPSETCVTGLSGETYSDPDSPVTSSAFFYLVRAANSCGAGVYGYDSDSVERVGAACN